MSQRIAETKNSPEFSKLVMQEWEGAGKDCGEERRWRKGKMGGRGVGDWVWFIDWATAGDWFQAALHALSIDPNPAMKIKPDPVAQSFSRSA